MHTRTLNVLGAWILQAADLLNAGITELELSTREAAALILVSTHQGRGIDWLQHRVGLTQSGTVRLVDRLVDEGWLVRGAESSRRSVRLQITDAGEQVIAAVLNERAATLGRLIETLRTEEHELLGDMAARMLAASERDRREADTACRLCDWPTCGEQCPVHRSAPQEGP